MDLLAQDSHSRHKTKSMKSPSSEDTGVQKKTSVELEENLPVADAILLDLSILINDEWLAVAKFLKIPEESLQKIHTDYGARQKEATYRMFLGWKEEMGKNATYGALTEALNKAGRGDLADLSTELIDPQERLLVLKETLERQHRLLDLHKRDMTKKSLSEWYERRLLHHMKELFRCQERLFDLHKREMTRKSLHPFTEWHVFADVREELLSDMEDTFCYQEKLIDLQEREMERKLFLSSSKSHDLQESLSFIKEILNCQERFIDLQQLELEVEETPFLHLKLTRLRRRLSIMEENLHLQQILLDSDVREALKKGTLDFQKNLEGRKGRDALEKVTLKSQNNLEDKLNHFIRCLKAKYATFVKSLQSTPWMKSENLNIEDLFVDVGLLLWNPSQSTMTGSGWQSLDSFQALFTHPQLRRAQSINVEGESGSGKTVLLHRMAHSWCINESFTKDVKLFILLPSGCVQENYFDCSLYMTIKRFLLPMNTILTESDVRDILSNTKSVLAVDDSSPDVVYRSLDSTSRYGLRRHGFKGLRDLQLGGKLQLICFTSDYTNTPYTDDISNMTVKLQKWQKKHQLVYLQKLLPNDEKTQDLILKRLGENSTLMNECGNSLFYMLFVHLLKDDLVCGKEVTIENLSQLFKSTFKSLTKNTITKPMETFFYPQGISKAAYECFTKNEWHIDLPAEERGYQMLVDLGILVKDQCNCFYKHSKHYMMSATVVTQRLVRFCHKIFQIWFAAIYLSECSNVREEYERLFFPKHLRQWSTPLSNTDNALLQRFICGLNSECSVILLEDLARGKYGNNKEVNQHFFLCLNEHCYDDDSLRNVVNAICERKREFTLGCSNQLVLKSMARILNLASRWKIPIECIDLRNHDLVDVKEDGLILSNGVRLGRLSGKEIRINKWCGNQLTNYLNKCEQLVEIRIFANDPRKRRHEIQKEVEGMHFKVRWESNYKHEEKERKTGEEDEIVNLVDLFEKVDIVSEIRPLLGEVLSKEMYVDAEGGRIAIEEAAISLDIPPGALRDGVNIRIAVVNAEGVILPRDDTPMVTPLVKCKPSGLAFEKPVTLVLPHCGILTDNKDHKVICMQGFFSDGYLQWNVDVNSQATVDKRKFSIELSHFCLRCGSFTDLENKRMRVFILKKKTTGTVVVKLWICNDDQSVFNNILNEEQDVGYQKVGSHEVFVLSKKLGDVLTKCRGIERKIFFGDIWNGDRRSTLFEIPIGKGDIAESLLARQIKQEDAYGLLFFIDDKTPCKRRKRKHSPTDSTIDEQPGPLISEPRNSGSGSSKTISIPQGRNKLKDINGDDVVSESSLRNLSGLLTSEWKDLGMKLGLTEAQMQHIEDDYQGKAKEIIFQMLFLWKKAKGREATYGHIFEKLKRVDRLDLVETPELKEKWVNT